MVSSISLVLILVDYPCCCICCCLLLPLGALEVLLMEDHLGTLRWVRDYVGTSIVGGRWGGLSVHDDLYVERSPIGPSSVGLNWDGTKGNTQLDVLDS